MKTIGLATRICSFGVILLAHEGEGAVNGRPQCHHGEPRSDLARGRQLHKMQATGVPDSS
jgi:hypothetical protein